MTSKTRKERCPNGFRRNPKSGHCESKTMVKISTSNSIPNLSPKQKQKKVRCPNGTRKNPKTGECELKSNTTKTNTKSQRNCKYGPRLVNGKCPKKKLNKIKTPLLSKTSSNSLSKMEEKQYLVTIQLEKDIDWRPNYNTLQRKKEFFADQVFGEELLMRADADLIGDDIQIDGKTITFILKEQDVDVSKKQFNKENIEACLARINNNKLVQHNRKKIKYTFEVNPL
jgi:hypothetical protein